MNRGLFNLGGVGIIVILAVLILLFGANFLARIARKSGSSEGYSPKEIIKDLVRGIAEGLREFNKATHEVTREMQDALGREPARKQPHDPGAPLIVWIAQGFGVGRIPAAPGTFGSLVGLLWFAVLVTPASFGFYLAGAALGVAFSIWICGQAELILKAKDPQSVVLDEIVAKPICFLGWIALLYFRSGLMPDAAYFFSRQNWPLTLAVFLLFRLFDIAKPWPVRRSQSLPGGWGVTIDDVLAALYVNLIVLAILGGHLFGMGH
jgi:phosphatidylglycerophosphatase A